MVEERASRRISPVCCVVARSVGAAHDSALISLPPNDEAPCVQGLIERNV